MNKPLIDEELRNHIWLIVRRDASGTDKRVEVQVGEIASLIQAHTTALLDRVLEEGPEDWPTEDVGARNIGKTMNAVNTKWRSLINRAKEGKL